MPPATPSRRSLLAFVLGLPALAAEARVNAEAGRPAIRGTDPVAYHLEGRPVPGRAEFGHTWGGATWHFASAANRDRFAAEPERYAPAYGGFCAYAVARGYTAPIDPAAWRIVGGRLYLNYDLRTRALWARDIPGEIARADRNWPALAVAGR
jgi:YHS domain-containing protein